jgi:terminase small subunit-like protein
VSGTPKYDRVACMEIICAKLREDPNLRKACKGEDLPAYSTVILWAHEDKAIADQYARARAIGLRGDLDEIVAIADEPCADAVEVQRQRNRIDARKFRLVKGLPREFGDRIEHEHAGKVTLEQLVAEATLAKPAE